MRRVEMIMGMPVSLDIPDATDEAAFTKLFDYFKTVDERFSPYRDTSEVSIFAKDTGKYPVVSPDLAYIISQTQHYEAITNGYFSAYYADTFDPSGYVKAWAIDRAVSLLHELGFHTFLINVGGDIAASGDEKVWNLAVQDPFDTQKMLGTVQLHNKAIATSGSYVRGDHIYNPHTKTRGTDLISVTIYGDAIIVADVLATACFAMGYDDALGFMKKFPNYAGLFIKQNGAMTPLNNFELKS